MLRVAGVFISAVMVFTTVACGARKIDSARNSTERNSDGRIELTLATLFEFSISSAVAEFNNTNPDYYIRVIDYSGFTPTPGQADVTVVVYNANDGLKRLNTEILSGNMPDILDTSSIPHAPFVARGYLEDLYPYIDSDSEIERGDFFENVFRAAEIDGGLYQIFPSFGIETIIGNPRVLGVDMDWTLAEFTALLEENPQADIPLSPWFTKMYCLSTFCREDAEGFIDWQTGTARFDTAEFVRLLEVANTFAEDVDYSIYYGSDTTEISSASDTAGGDTFVISNTEDVEIELVATGRQIAVPTSIMSFDNYLWYEALFGGEIVIKSAPAAKNDGLGFDTVRHSYAITSASENKEGAWEFLRMFLGKDLQLSDTIMGFPTNKEAFNARAKQTMDHSGGETPPNDTETSGGGAARPKIRELTHADVENILSLIDSVSFKSGAWLTTEVWNIIAESAQDYFNGLVRADVAAERIQSKVSIHISELR